MMTAMPPAGGGGSPVVSIDRTAPPALPVAIREQLAAARRPRDTASTLPAACYTDSALFEHERSAVFHRSWIGLGRSDRWTKIGDYSALDVAGVPTIVLRDEGGVLRAFANSCRHRGTQLLTGDGCTRIITCPFHSWGYGLDGSLRGAPHMDRTRDFDRAAHALRPFRTGERDGFAFLAMEPDTLSLDEWLGDFSQVHAPWSLGELKSTRRHEFEVACNWKAFIEVFNEYYHLQYVHPSTIRGLYGDPDDVDEVSGSYATQFGVTHGSAGLLAATQGKTLPLIPGLKGRNRQGTRYTWVYPNLTFAASSEMVWSYDVFPVSPERSRVGMTVCFHPRSIQSDGFEARMRHYCERLDTVLAEDLPVLERQQRGLTSPYATPGRFSWLEPSVASFAAWYARIMDPPPG